MHNNFQQTSSDTSSEESVGDSIEPPLIEDMPESNSTGSVSEFS